MTKLLTENFCQRTKTTRKKGLNRLTAKMMDVVVSGVEEEDVIKAGMVSCVDTVTKFRQFILKKKHHFF